MTELETDITLRERDGADCGSDNGGHWEGYKLHEYLTSKFLYVFIMVEFERKHRNLFEKINYSVKGQIMIDRVKEWCSKGKIKLKGLKRKRVSVMTFSNLFLFDLQG